MEAEHNKAESGREHQRKAALFSASEKKVSISNLLNCTSHYVISIIILQFEMS